MAYQVRREMCDGELCRLSLGIAWVDEYLDFLHARCRPNTWLNYAHDLKAFFNIIDKPVADISTVDIFLFIQCQSQQSVEPPLTENCLPQKVCKRTLKRRLCAVSGLFSYLLMREDSPVQRNPVPAGLSLRGQIPESTPRFNPLLRVPETLPRLVPVEQVQRFLASLNTYRDKAMILLMVLAGLRKSEVLDLNIDDLDLEKRTVVVRHGKGGRGRICCVAGLFFKVLDQYLKTERPKIQATNLFVVLKGPGRGKPLSISGLNTIMAYHRRSANTPKLNCHRLRHTCLTMLREAGMSLEALQQQAGHQNINTTRIYLHLSNTMLREEYFKVSEQLFQVPVEEVHHA